jgi:hypothetical protein
MKKAKEYWSGRKIFVTEGLLLALALATAGPPAVKTVISPSQSTALPGQAYPALRSPALALKEKAERRGGK